MAAALTAAVLVAACSSGPDGEGRTNAVGPAEGGTHHGARFEAPPAAALRAGERFVNLTMPEPYTPTAPNGATDEYRCFLVDPKLNSTAFLTGSQFLPQNVDIVHHAIFFRVDKSGAQAARKLDADTAGPGWRCFGDSGVDGDVAWVAHWAPGANEVLLAPGLGHPMPAGSQLVMQVHYNLLATGGNSGADKSGIRLRLAAATKAIKPLQTAELPAPVELPCAADESGPLCAREAAIRDVAKRFGDEAGEAAGQLNEFCNKGRKPVAGPTQSCSQRMDQSGVVYAAAGHMHLLGRSIKVELNPGTAKAQTLLDIPAYNFDDQAIRPLTKPVAVKVGDTLRVTCTHDVSLRKRLPQLRTAPARYVVWGDGTSDEMCLGLLLVSGS